MLTVDRQRQPGAKTDNQDNAGANFSEWLGKLRKTNPDLADKLVDDRFQGFNKVEGLGLPCYKRAVMPVEEFMKNPKRNLGSLDCERFYVILLTEDSSKPRYVKDDLTRDDAVKFVKESLTRSQAKQYSVILLQFYQNIYGGNIVIDDNQNVLVELIEGRQGPVARGTKTPPFSVWRDEYTGSFKYSFDDQKLRKTVFETLLHIPHTEDVSRALKFQTGYYEFALVKKENSEKIEPIFFDYKDNPHWYNIGKANSTG